MTCRLVRYSDPDAAMNEALEEAMLLARQREQPLETIRLWQNERAVALGSNVDLQSSVDEGQCRKNGVWIVRRVTSGKAVFQDPGTLNLTYVFDQGRISPGTPNLADVYRRLCDPVAAGISKFRVKVEVDEYGQSLFVNRTKVAEAGAAFYYDLILFRLSVYVDTDLEVLEKVLLRKGVIAPLSRILGKSVQVEDVAQNIVSAVSQRLGIQLEGQDVSPLERRLATRLREIKYSQDGWNREAKAPLSVKDVLVDVYVAYPPTRSCQAIMANVKSAAEALSDRVEVRVWMRGKGLGGSGRCPPGVPMTSGLIKASKDSIVPAVIINGKISFAKDVPSKEELEAAIAQELGG